MSQHTILVADDESRILDSVSIKLENAGFRVLKAGDGQEALDSAIRNRPDLLITDYQMPLLSGLELCHRLRQAKSPVPAIMLTAPGYELNPSKTTQNGIRRMICKPFDSRQLLASVNDVLRETAEQAA